MSAIDHLVIGTPDLDALGARFAALGFTVGARNRHPWGTENRIIQFADETFLELITVGDAGLIPPHSPRHFSFGAFVRDAIARAPGLSMLVLKSSDAPKDAARYAADGIGDFAPFDFARKGVRPDGSAVEVAFSLAFARDELAPDCAFFACQHHFPQNFWAKSAQAHDNGVSGTARITMLAENPSDHYVFLSSFTGQREMRATSSGIEIVAGKGVIEVLDNAAFAFQYGVEGRVPPTPRFAGITLTCKNPGDIAARAIKNDLPLLEKAGAVILLPNAECSTAIRFEKAERA